MCAPTRQSWALAWEGMGRWVQEQLGGMPGAGVALALALGLEA